jgi:pimeloyl-ACP methyl ester carboxylesterase
MTSNDVLSSIEVFGVPLFYEVSGAGSPVVLIHEGIGDSRMFTPQVAALSARHQVVRYDLHGYGRSGKPQTPYTNHEALNALLQHLDIKKTAILGMSMGGNIALDYTLTYPEKVSGLILIGAGLDGVPSDPETQAFIQPMIDAYDAEDVPRIIEETLHVWIDGPNRTAEEIDPAVRDLMRTLLTTMIERERELGVEASQLEPLAVERLNEINVPTLVIIGDGDVHEIVRTADLLAQSIAGARKVVIPNVAHVPNLERPEEINQLALDFLAVRE